MTIKDKGDVWGWCLDGETVCYEDGTSAELTPDLVEITFGREAGKTLDEVDDVSYLEWMLKSAVEKNDDFQAKCARLRLLEIKG